AGSAHWARWASSRGDTASLKMRTRRSSGTWRPSGAAIRSPPGYTAAESSAGSRRPNVSDPVSADPSFETAIGELEQVVRKLEDGTTTLDDALAAYERGVGLLKCCYQHLRVAEQRILKLTGSDGDGRPKLEPFEHSAAVAEERPETRRRKKPPDTGLGFE